MLGWIAHSALCRKALSVATATFTLPRVHRNTDAEGDITHHNPQYTEQDKVLPEDDIRTSTDHSSIEDHTFCYAYCMN